jgi:hypothetical protein
MNKYNQKQLYAILNQLNHLGANLTKEEVVLEFTDCRTTHTNEMQPNEWKNMIGTLNLKIREISSDFQEGDRKRKKILANMRLAGYSVDEAKLWAEKMKKLPFNQIPSAQLSELIYASEKVKGHFINKI